jgi:ABC-type bacteriocin/lantibiotic exporter with double-glycine peptidase domain
VLFFALASRLVERRRRLLVVAAAGFMALVTVQQVFWRLSRPVAYDFAGRIDEDGVCLQSSGYTCAAASMATLLRVHGIEAAEGEMAELSGTIPGRGASYFQAAGGLRKKLRRMGRSERPILRVPGRRGLEAIPCPFLAGVGHGFLFDHMVCVLGVGPGSVRIGDPLRGARTMDRREFEDRWQGIAVVLER